MQVARRSKISLAVYAGSTAFMLSTGSLAHAYELYNQDETTINAELEAVLGLFHSQQSYAISGSLDEGNASWQEAYLKYGLSFTHGLGSASGELYGKLNWISSGTFGDGDAAGITNGSERTTKIEDAFIGWRSGLSVPMLGDNGLEISFGRQTITVGDGFLIAGDAVNMGDGIASDGSLDRGGAYYIAARKAFDETAVLRIGGDEGLRGDLMWIKSDNRAQAEAEMAIATLEHVSDKGTIGFTYIDVLDTNSEFDAVGRNENKTYSMRAQGNGGVENLLLAGEYASQNASGGSESAWYLEAGWTFSNVTWSPAVNYRYSRFSEGYDPLFYGWDGIGTWFQGEVASNYAGPFNSNTRVHHVGLKASPLESLSIGVLTYKFDTLSSAGGLNQDAIEIDLYAEWAVRDNVFLMPVIGFYNPKADVNGGGTQLGNDDTNIYAQLYISTSF